MAYQGSTAASSIANPPILVNGMGPTPNYSVAGNVLGSSLQTTTAFGAAGNNIWRYTSSDGSTLLQGAGYFTDGLALGMHNGDILISVSQTSLGTSPTCQVGVLMTTNSTAGFNVSIGAAIQSS
jgi:cytolysin (calcineurin-like family phosphatase)